MEKAKLEFRWYATPEEGIRMMYEAISGYHPLHSHDDFIELVYIVSGKGEQTINGKSIPIEKGDLFLFNASVEHSFTADGDTPLLVCNCLFLPTAIGLSGDSCRDFLDIAWRFLFYSSDAADSEIDYLRLSGLDNGEIERILQYMAEEYGKKENGYIQILRSELTKLLILLFRRFASETPQQKKQYLRRLIVEDALDYLRTHYSESITCELLAQKAYLSVSYFRELFHAHTGMTVVSALQKIRIERACALLRETSLTVSEVANRVGYSDMKFFYKVFHRWMQVSPGAFRKRERR